MKILFVLIVVLVVAGLVAASNVIRQKRDELAEEVQNTLVDGANALRRNVAKRLDFSNMNKLSWDEDTESMVTDNDCERTEILESAAEQSGDVVKTGTAEAVMKEISTNFYFLNCLHPLQTGIFCRAKTCKKVHYNCMCGPKNSFSEDDMERGKAGSDCDEEDDGLCVDGSSNIFTAGTLFILVSVYMVTYFVF